MKYRTSFSAVALVLVVTGATSCAVDHLATAPASVRTHSSGSDIRAAINQEIAAIDFLLSPSGFRASLQTGGDTALIESRIQLAKKDLAVLQAKLHQLDNGQRAAETILTDGGGEPPACLISGSLDDCFTSQTTTLSIDGNGATSTHTEGVFHINTTTTLRENGQDYDAPPKETANFGMSNFWNGRFTFRKPDCNASSHVVVGTTNHHLSASYGDAGPVEGNKPSATNTGCAHQFLTISLSPSSIPVNSVSNITVGNLPEDGCGLTVTSSNTSVADIHDWGSDHYTANSGQTGTTTITAKCSDGRSASKTLTVTGSADTSVVRVDKPRDNPTNDDADCPWYVYTLEDGWSVTVISEPWQSCVDPSLLLYSASPTSKHGLLFSSAPTTSASSPDGKTTKVHVTIVGAGAFRMTAPVAFQQDRRGKANAVIIVDTTTALPSDLDAALFGLAAFNDGLASGQIPTNARVFVVARPAGVAAKSWKSGRAADLLGQLRTAKVTDQPGVGKGRSIDVTVDVPKTKVKNK